MSLVRCTARPCRWHKGPAEDICIAKVIDIKNKEFDGVEDEQVCSTFFWDDVKYDEYLDYLKSQWKAKF